MPCEGQLKDELLGFQDVVEDFKFLLVELHAVNFGPLHDKP